MKQAQGSLKGANSSRNVSQAQKAEDAVVVGGNTLRTREPTRAKCLTGVINVMTSVHRQGPCVG